jgi:hypothetical protein
MVTVRGTSGVFVAVLPVGAKGMQTKQIVNGVVKSQTQKVERHNTAQRACQGAAESLQIAVAGNGLGKVEQRFVDYSVRSSHSDDASVVRPK